MEEGVTFINPDTCMVDYCYNRKRHCYLPGSYVGGHDPNRRKLHYYRQSRIRNSKIGNNCEIIMSQIDQCILHDKVKIGPYST